MSNGRRIDEPNFLHLLDETNFLQTPSRNPTSKEYDWTDSSNSCYLSYNYNYNEFLFRGADHLLAAGGQTLQDFFRGRTCARGGQAMGRTDYRETGCGAEGLRGERAVGRKSGGTEGAGGGSAARRT